MLEEIFLQVNEWMTGSACLAAMGCFLWGMVSVMFSPCHLASIPLIIAYVAGQETVVKPRQAIGYSVLFSLGLFITISLLGILCALLGRMLGDVGNYWQILVGLVLVWVALGMLGVEKCSFYGGSLQKLTVKGYFGAFAVGLSFGVLSGSCTFGFIAPILAVITIQEKVMAGILFIVLFALGHCLPIVIAGSSTAAVRNIMENSLWQGAGAWFRRGSGLLIGTLGLYFIINPFIAG